MAKKMSFEQEDLYLKIRGLLKEQGVEDTKEFVDALIQFVAIEKEFSRESGFDDGWYQARESFYDYRD